ncbi:hypothetical protein ACQUQU_08925 [Thalassolituus sp. LLYu03]|uniref:hypothetical protein n=1 Tax=Thalassolituus sp. LLYu03 TaxID=3421656 RepID=UPI003D27F5EC
MLVIRTDRCLAALKQSRPNIYSAFGQSIQGAVLDHDFIRVEEAAFLKECRPCAKCDSIKKGERCKAECITVPPGAKLSMQLHHHYAEQGIVMPDTAKLTHGDTTFLVTESQSKYILIGQMHSLANQCVTELEMIGAQSGSYLGEENILRLKMLMVRCLLRVGSNGFH